MPALSPTMEQGNIASWQVMLRAYRDAFFEQCPHTVHTVVAIDHQRHSVLIHAGQGGG